MRVIKFFPSIPTASICMDFDWIKHWRKPAGESLVFFCHGCRMNSVGWHNELNSLPINENTKVTHGMCITLTTSGGGCANVAASIFLFSCLLPGCPFNAQNKQQQQQLKFHQGWIFPKRSFYNALITPHSVIPGGGLFYTLVMWLKMFAHICVCVGRIGRYGSSI